MAGFLRFTQNNSQDVFDVCCRLREQCQAKIPYTLLQRFRLLITGIVTCLVLLVRVVCAEFLKNSSYYEVN